MPRNIAFIPLRGGSKSIPLKNIRIIGGKPLAFWTIQAALDSRCIDEVVVSTDSEQISNLVGSLASPKLKIFRRSDECATDVASTESAMLEYFEGSSCEKVFLIQATSPLLEARDIDSAFTMLNQGSYDSLLSVVRMKRFLWRKEGSAFSALNYDPSSRPRRQDFEGELVENGALYICSHADLLRTRCRLSGRVACYEMEEESFHELDEPADWELVEGILNRRRLFPVPGSLRGLKVLATDVDGCLTDAGMYYSEQGDEMKKFNTRDGVALRLFQDAGVRVGIITAEDRDLNRRRSAKLNLDFEYHAVSDKKSVLDELCSKFHVQPEQIAYVGDDLNDLGLLRSVGFSFCPSDAHLRVRSQVAYQCKAQGGQGVIREIFDLYSTQENP